MAEKIKKFFQKKKQDAKFKRAGPGRRLDAEASSQQMPVGGCRKDSAPTKRGEPTEATRQAAEAALARIGGSHNKTSAAFNTSLAAIQAQVRRELEAERKIGKEESEAVSRPKETTLSHNLAVQGVYFRCPLISEEVLSKDQWRIKIKEFLFDQLEEERGLTACLIIHSCNYNQSKVQDCVDILVRYLDNIIGNPTETKFHKIRCSNATYKDKVEPILGGTEFLFAAGFRQEKVEHNGALEDFWVFNERNNENGVETLEFLRDALKSADRVELEVDRNIQVLSPAQALRRIDLPQDFYSISPEEIKREQQLRTEEMEKQMQLRTKAMREKDELREMKKYKFTLIRVRFPDGLFLQGTFSVYEKFSEVMKFVESNLDHSGLPFILTAPTGHKFEENDDEQTLVHLRLVPAVILNFQWDPSIGIADEFSQSGENHYLKPEVMMLVKSL